MSGPPTPWDAATYDAAWTRMQASGKDPHGEVAFLERLLTRTGRHQGPILDAGCGTGRVAIELARRGHVVEGTDVDAAMLGQARQKAPEMSWHEADLATLDLGRTFDVVVMAGNVILFVDPPDRAAAVAACERHLNSDGLLVAGFQLDRAGRIVSLDDWDRWCRGHGLTLVERWSTWDETPWNSTDTYVVTVHQRGTVG